MLEQITNVSHIENYAIQAIIGIVLVVGLAIICVKYTKSKNPFWSKKSTGSAFTSYAMEDLKKRYSKGEITKEEFDKMKDGLS